jgi:hypothetical protein
MRLLFAFLLVLATAVSAPAAAQPEGSFALAQINDQPLPAASPAETNIIIQEMDLRLGAAARYTMRFRVRRDGTDASFQVEASGTYRSEGDQLSLRPDEGSVGEPVTYRWVWDGEMLRLIDEREDEYRFVRRVAAAAGEPWSPGTWRAVRLNGREFPAPWPVQPQLTIADLVFVFTEDGQTSVRLVGTEEGESVDEEARARYAVTGDRLTILDEDGSTDEEYAWTLRGESLELRDLRGDTYTFTRVVQP